MLKLEKIVKTNDKPKIEKLSEKKLLFRPKNNSFSKIKLTLKTFILSFRNGRHWLLLVSLIIIAASLIWFLSQSWIFQASFSETKTYPKASVLDTNVGDLNADQLNKRLNKLKSEFENRKITLVNDKDKWIFDFSKLGIALDIQATSEAVWRLNNLDIMDKYRLLTGNIKSVIPPIIQYNSKKCIESLSTISIVQVEPTDASFYFDQELKIKPDRAGTKFNADLTCQELFEQFATNKLATNINLDTLPANLTEVELQPKLSQVQTIVGKPLSLKSDNYQLTLTSEQLLSLLEVSKKGSDIQVNWSETKLDDLINSIAGKVNTYNSSPALGACQYLVSNGGSQLDKEATKKIFKDLETNNSRSYNLSVNSYAPVIGNLSPVAPGNKGTVYLTFDDGLLYGNQIMNYASCYHVKITFFEIGSRVGVDAAALRRAVSEGHAVQSHGYDHAAYDYGKHDYSWQFNDMAQSISAITDVTGIRPTYFRPPGGNRSASTYDAASANGLKLILWGASSSDTAGIGSSAICANVLAGVFPGASVLMHSSKQTTANAVPCIIEGLAARGYNMQALR